MRVQLLHNKDCHVWQKLFTELQEMGLEPEVILVESDEQAREYKFSGSPQVLVEGKDIDPMAERITNYHESGCRVYFWNGKVYEYPPKEMIEAAISKR
ncbi:MAG: DUF2703 domain-containing protein [Parcubacteria group bacterium]|nr:DUF2703 domain-containing protein [Parcubacteria group bacterium]